MTEEQLYELQRHVRSSKGYCKWEKQVLGRDKKTCQLCGAHPSTIIHHIVPLLQSLADYEYKPFKEWDWSELEKLWDVEIGITLCHDCHKFVERSVFNTRLWWADKKAGIWFAKGYIEAFRQIRLRAAVATKVVGASATTF